MTSPSRWRRASPYLLAGLLTAALFVAVFPANIKMALDSTDRSELYRLAVWARLTIQAPLIWWAVSIARHARSDQPRETR
jgi:uncharacterized membrane protein